MTRLPRPPQPGRCPDASCPPCHGDCSQSDLCPAREPLPLDFGSQELRSGLLIALGVWLSLLLGILAVALLS